VSLIRKHEIEHFVEGLDEKLSSAFSSAKRGTTTGA
jgi:hypothetical protein